VLVGFDTRTLPPYIPQINHGASRTAQLTEPWITVPLYAVAGRDTSRRYRVRYKSGEELREALRVAPETNIIITSVTPDSYIEDFWEEHAVRDIPAQLAQLKIAAMTVPNYSFMLGVPRTNSLYNLTRIFRASEAISRAGIPTVLHLNASTKRDWEHWRDVLREQAHIQCVCVEFQTGTGKRAIGDKYFAGLVELQNAVGRDLHPIALAGCGRLVQLRQHFRSFTAVDATPFLKTMKRQVLHHASGAWKWRKQETPKGASLSRRLAENINWHRARQLQRIGVSSDGDGWQWLLAA
jgi:hypothetical protein